MDKCGYTIINLLYTLFIYYDIKVGMLFDLWLFVYTLSILLMAISTTGIGIMDIQFMGVCIIPILTYIIPEEFGIVQMSMILVE